MSLSKNMPRYRNTEEFEKKYSTDEEDTTTNRLNVKKMNMRKENWSKKGNTAIGDGAEIRSPIFNTIFKKAAYQTTDEQNNSSSEAGSTKQQWQPGCKRHSMPYGHDDEEIYTGTSSNRTFMRSPSSRTSKMSLIGNVSNEHNLEHTMTPTLLMRSASFRQGYNSLLNENQINYITLLGFAIGLLVSKILQYLLIYFNWLLNQVKQLRNVFLGDGSIMDFLNFDDNSRYDLRIKLLIMPILAICCFLYILVAILQYAIRLLLKDVPAFLMAMLQKVFSEI